MIDLKMIPLKPSGEYGGIYRLSRGGFLRCFESADNACDEGEYGNVYYTIHDSKGLELDGGLMGYDLGDTMSDVQDFIEWDIEDLIASEGTDFYNQIDEVFEMRLEIAAKQCQVMRAQDEITNIIIQIKKDKELIKKMSDALKEGLKELNGLLEE